jgi:hypothetical protein
VSRLYIEGLLEVSDRHDGLVEHGVAGYVREIKAGSSVQKTWLNGKIESSNTTFTIDNEDGCLTELFCDQFISKRTATVELNNGRIISGCVERIDLGNIIAVTVIG